MVNVNGLMGKIKKNADLAAFAASAYMDWPNLETLWDWYTGPSVWNEVKHTLKDFNVLKFKLMKSDHMYTMLIKAAAIAYGLAEFGVINSSYKNLAWKVAKGAGAAALTLPSNSPLGQNNPNPPESSMNSYHGYGY